MGRLGAQAERARLDFRADDPAAYGGNANGFLGLPPGTTCNNVTLINTQNVAGRTEADLVEEPVHQPHAGRTSTWNSKAATWDLEPPRPCKRPVTVGAGPDRAPSAKL